MTGFARSIIFLTGLLAAGLLLVVLTWPRTHIAPGMVLKPVSFDQLPGWANDDPAQALGVFKRTCQRLEKMSPDTAMGGHNIYGYVRDWLDICQNAKSQNVSSARAFFESAFVASQVLDAAGADGLFTGYYESEVHGARHQGGVFQTPLYARPDDLVDVDLGAFAPDLKGRRTAGLVIDHRLQPYPDRAAIYEGALSSRAKPLVWLDDPVDAFFMEIQGSGRVLLDDGSSLRLTFSGQNGHAYTAIGQVLIRSKILRREEVTMASIRQWLTQNPKDRDAVLRQNRSYVFFRESPITDPGLGPPGADGLALTPGRSLAIDRSFHALGVPVFLNTADAAALDPPIQRLMVTQDTGGAIRGVVRGDVFWGYGPDAAARAGRMKDRGQLYVLLPRGLVARAQK